MKKIKVKNILLLVVISYIIFIFVSQTITMHKIKQDITEKQIELQKVDDQSQKLQDEIKLSKSDQYIEKLAREKLHLIKEGETPVINTSK
ncbi:septum formation initiator family protein [Clostridium sp. JN-9]|uniref:FtsB family cell division protein n=1 Tax=Clostridium sp. JN-9 TaxID=2507159 RepID=UPI000FFE1ADD|nr:septum formation initiator family protein [Clostridium sp. JN-9]QAT41726.1 septum formation initiator family protein [Clostridium sp. JN-9]